MKTYAEQLRDDIAVLTEMIQAARDMAQFKEAADLMERRRKLIAELEALGR